MSETLGRGNFNDESRIEKISKYASENGGNNDGSTATPPRSPVVEKVLESTRSSAHSILSSSGASTMSGNAFSHQIELMQNLQQFLSTFQDRLLQVATSYQNQVDKLHDAGLMDEIHRDFSNQEMAETCAAIKQLVDRIGNSDIPHAQKIIAYLEQGLNH